MAEQFRSLTRRRRTNSRSRQSNCYVLLHELHERNWMAEGWPYRKAHAESSRIESRCRHHPDQLHDALAAEGWA